MSPIESAFLAAILANPDDDSPRLIYADWLEEQGQGERAEFIRVQVALGKESQFSIPRILRGGRHVLDLRCREVELMDSDLSEDWTFDAREGIAPRWRRGVGHYESSSPYAEFRRGFVHSVRCTADDWLTHADKLLAAQPVREVALTTMPQREDLIRWVGRNPGHLNDQNWAALMAGEAERFFAVEWPGITFTLPGITFTLPGFLGIALQPGVASEPVRIVPPGSRPRRDTGQLRDSI